MMWLIHVFTYQRSSYMVFGLMHQFHLLVLLISLSKLQVSYSELGPHSQIKIWMVTDADDGLDNSSIHMFYDLRYNHGNDAQG